MYVSLRMTKLFMSKTITAGNCGGIRGFTSVGTDLIYEAVEWILWHLMACHRMHRAFSCKQVTKTFSKNVEMVVPKITESRYRDGSGQARQGIKGLVTPFLHLQHQCSSQ